MYGLCHGHICRGRIGRFVFSVPHRQLLCFSGVGGGYRHVFNGPVRSRIGHSMLRVPRRQLLPERGTIEPFTLRCGGVFKFNIIYELHELCSWDSEPVAGAVQMRGLPERKISRDDGSCSMPSLLWRQIFCLSWGCRVRELRGRNLFGR